MMTRIHRHVKQVKEKLFKEAFEELKTNNKDGQLEILEIGIGTGDNFRNFPINSNLHILDKTDIFLNYLKDSIRSQTMVHQQIL